MKTGKLSIIVAMAIVGAVLQIAPSLVRAQALPTPDCGFTATNNCLVFGDFTVYSLNLLQHYQTTSTTPLFNSLQGFTLVYKENTALVDISITNAQGTPLQASTGIDNPYDAMSGFGSLDNLRFLMTSALFNTGQYLVPSDPSGGPTADNLLQASSLVNNTSTYTTGQPYGSFNDPTKYLANCFTDLDGCLPLWDADVSALRTALGDGELVFFFVNNETGDSGDLAGQDLDAWARVCLTDTTVGGVGSICFTLDGTGMVTGVASDPQVAGVSDILPTNGDIWARVHSDICVADGTNGPIPEGQVFLGACSIVGISGQTINQSLGQDEATYAIYNQLLSSLVKDPNSAYDVMTIDARLAHLNDGGDIFWIGSVAIQQVCPPTDPACVPVPEPGSLTLTGLGLALLAGMLGWRRRFARPSRS